MTRCLLLELVLALRERHLERAALLLLLLLRELLGREQLRLVQTPSSLGRLLFGRLLFGRLLLGLATLALELLLLQEQPTLGRGLLTNSQ